MVRFDIKLFSFSDVFIGGKKWNIALNGLINISFYRRPEFTQITKNEETRYSLKHTQNTHTILLHTNSVDKALDLRVFSSK